MDILVKLMDPSYLNIKLDEATMDRLVALTAGLDLNQTEAVFCETFTDYAKNGKKNLDLTTVSETKADQINKSAVLRVKANVKYGFERVGGYAQVKRFITEAIIMPMKEPERARALGIEQPKGAIFFGPPGTGKTVIVEGIAKELGLPFVTLDPENFMSSFVGESERNLRSAIQVIEEMAPVVVFIDESMVRTNTS
jgi:SpoVK/Ycf46/Vps4 family AAA+-type ATPase